MSMDLSSWLDVAENAAARIGQDVERLARLFAGPCPPAASPAELERLCRWREGVTRFGGAGGGEALFGAVAADHCASLAAEVRRLDRPLARALARVEDVVAEAAKAGLGGALLVPCPAWYSSFDFGDGRPVIACRLAALPEPARSMMPAELYVDPGDGSGWVLLGPAAGVQKFQHPAAGMYTVGIVESVVVPHAWYLAREAARMTAEAAAAQREQREREAALARQREGDRQTAALLAEREAERRRRVALSYLERELNGGV
jgi:hypothetical protein